MLRLWKSLRHRLEWLALSLAVKLVPLFPRGAVHQLGQFLGRIAASIDAPGRKVALANLEAAFGEQFGPAERKRIARGSYQQFFCTMLELLWSPRLTRENYSDFIEIVGSEEAMARVENDDGVIVACYHYGNFEWLGLALGFIGLKIMIISQRFKNPLLDPIFKKLREHAGHEMIPQERAVARFIRGLKSRRAVGLLVDLTITPREAAVALDCFGMKTSATAAHAWLHQRTGALIIPTHCEPLPDGRYRVVFHPALEVPAGALRHEIAQMCWNSFEPYVRANPAPWLWVYKQWRYRPEGTTRAYPFYAEVQPPFEKLLRKQARLIKRRLKRAQVQQTAARAPLGTDG